MGFNRCAGIILAPTNSTVFCGHSTVQHVRRFASRLFDSCQVVVVCYCRCFRLLVLCFLLFGLYEMDLAFDLLEIEGGNSVVLASDNRGPRS